MGINLQLPGLTELRPRITVIGVGGAGGNAVNNMIESGLNGVEFIAANTDAQALSASSAGSVIQMGVGITEGLGAGSQPEIGAAAAEETLEEIRSHLDGCHLLFIAAGMGGGTGTGAAPVIARTAKELGVMTIAVVTKPFEFEGQRRMRSAEAEIAALAKHVDTLIVKFQIKISSGRQRCFGTLMAGHSHPAVIKAVEGRLHKGTAYGMPHNMEWELAEEICTRFPVEMCRFGNSGTEATMHTIRLARAATGRDKIIKFEGCYHGVHDTVLISYKPPVDRAGDPKNPIRVKASEGIPDGTADNTIPTTFNDLEAVENAFRANAGQVAAVILEPIAMNIGS